MIAELMAPLSKAGTATSCPGCGSGHTTWVSAAGQDNLLCKTCGTCWHGDAGSAGRVDVSACSGCGLRAVCVAAAGALAA